MMITPSPHLTALQKIGASIRPELARKCDLVGLHDLLRTIVDHQQGSQITPHLGWILDETKGWLFQPETLSVLLRSPVIATALQPHLPAILDQTGGAGRGDLSKPLIAYEAIMPKLAKSIKAHNNQALTDILDSRIPTILDYAATAGNSKSYADIVNLWYRDDKGQPTASFKRIAPSLEKLLQNKAQRIVDAPISGFASPSFVQLVALAQQNFNVPQTIHDQLCPYASNTIPYHNHAIAIVTFVRDDVIGAVWKKAQSPGAMHYCQLNPNHIEIPPTAPAETLKLLFSKITQQTSGTTRDNAKYALHALNTQRDKTQMEYA